MPVPPLFTVPYYIHTLTDIFAQFILPIHIYVNRCIGFIRACMDVFIFPFSRTFSRRQHKNRQEQQRENQ